MGTKTSPNANMRISHVGLDLIKESEGWYPKAYQDPVGVWTIGWGTIDPTVAFPGNIITKEVGTKYLAEELKETEGYIKSLVKVELNQNQFDALCSFIYNLGVGNFQKSDLLKLLNRGNYSAAAAQFPRFINAWDRRTKKWIQPPGLKIRRNKEMMLFLKEPELDLALDTPTDTAAVDPSCPPGLPATDAPAANKGALWDLLAWSQTFRAHLVGIGGVLTAMASELGKIGDKPLLMFGLGMVATAIVAGIYIKYRDLRAGR